VTNADGYCSACEIAEAVHGLALELDQYFETPSGEPISTDKN
jgi:hypothetical protein